MAQLFPSVESFERTFREFYPLLVAFANKQINDIPVSEDIVQDLFVYLYEKRELLEIRESLKSYLFKAVFNKCKDFHRKQSTIKKYENSIRKNEQLEFRDILTEVEFESKVYNEINTLPDKCRQIFMLSRFDDQSNDSIAKQLNVSKRTVETQISKALKILRSKLSPNMFFMFFA